MKKEHLEAQFELESDLIINYRSQQSKKLKYIVATTDFSTKFIKNKKRPKEAEGKLLVYCWDSDTFKQLDTSTITSIEPLSSVLKNEAIR